MPARNAANETPADGYGKRWSGQGGSKNTTGYLLDFFYKTILIGGMRKALYLLILLFLCSVTYGGTYYTDYINGDNDTGDGSAESPYQTVSHALRQHKAEGDIIKVVSNGDQVYIDSASSFWTGRQTAITKYSVITDDWDVDDPNWIVVEPNSGDVRLTEITFLAPVNTKYYTCGVKFNGFQIGDGGSDIKDIIHLALVDCNVRDWDGQYPTTASRVGIERSVDIDIDNTTFTHFRKLNFDSCANITISNSNLSWGYDDLVQFSTNYGVSRSITFDNSVLHDAWNYTAGGTHCDGIQFSNLSSPYYYTNIIVRGCTFYNGNNIALFLQESNYNTLVENCLFYDYSHATAFILDRSYAATIRNNDIVGTSLILSNVASHTRIKLANNIGKVQFQSSFNSSWLDEPNCVGNIVYYNGGDQELSAATNTIYTNFDSLLNACFTNATTDDYTLKSGSPAIDYGSNILDENGTSVLSVTDLAGNLRSDNKIDSGAYESGAAPPDPNDPNIPDPSYPDPNTSTPDPNQVLVYLFNGTLLDSSGLSNDGNLVGGGDPCYVEGYDSNGIYFDGTHAVYADALADTDSLTFMCWLKLDEGGEGDLFWEGDGTTWVDTVVAVNADLSIRWRTKSQTSANQLTSSAGVITAGQWHHIAVTNNTTYMAIYVDGNMVAEQTGTYHHNGGHYNLQIGRYAVLGDDGSYITGTMDTVKIFKRYFTPEEIAAEIAQTYYYYYISPDGNDTTGNGSDVTPWATLSKAYSELSDGNSVNLLAGTYDAPTLDETKGMSFYGTSDNSEVIISGGIVLGPNTIDETIHFESLTISDPNWPIQVQFDENQCANLTFNGVEFVGSSVDILYGEPTNPRLFFIEGSPSVSYRPSALDANDLRLSESFNGLAGLLDLPDVNDVRSGTAYDGETKTGTLEVITTTTGRGDR
jgi:hypothetical protein